MSQPLISVVTPSFNQGRFLRATIESVLGQSYPHLEQWVVDGGSTDETLDVLREYAGDPRFRFISEPDGGQADAINKGLARSRGEIFVWLNSDDMFLPGALERVAAAWRARGPAVYYGLARLVDEGGGDLGPCPAQTAHLSAERLLRLSALPMQPATFAPTAALRALGGLDTRLHYALDYDLWVRLSASQPIRHIPHELALYRLHDSSKTVTRGERFVAEVEGILAAAAAAGRITPRQARAFAQLFGVRAYLVPEVDNPRAALRSFAAAVRAEPLSMPRGLFFLAKGLARRAMGDRVWAGVRAARARLG